MAALVVWCFVYRVDISALQALSDQMGYRTIRRRYDTGSSKRFLGAYLLRISLTEGGRRRTKHTVDG